MEKNTRLRSEILSFRQKDRRNLYQAWERFNSMIFDFPRHHQTNEVLVHTFIKGLETYTKILLDSATSEQALEKTYNKLYTLLNKISKGNPEWNEDVSRSTLWKVVGVLEVNQLTSITVQIASLKN